ncbi:hypothetical protein DM01DRAFT_1332351 [Hesseltinella vesiculosa]|uniref:Uncharacterized protein n=1 Tax=Hesseltinella vesiculosa TaxID=101127 RepID=A0A1X2GUT5_9FUNG|nr:hypothetical protein DM01DRAFT_1332351 [Hesseltinella vesiculosa]
MEQSASSSFIQASSSSAMAISSSANLSGKKEEIRSCRKSLPSILVQGTKEDDDLKVSILTTIKVTMQAATTYSQDMASMVQASMIKFMTSPEDHPHPVKATDIVPGFACRNKCILQNGYLLGSPPP